MYFLFDIPATITINFFKVLCKTKPLDFFLRLSQNAILSFFLSVRKQRNNTVQDLGVVLFRCLRLLVPYCVAVLSVGVGTICTGVGDSRKCQDRPNYA
jgi:hypothetical protein